MPITALVRTGSGPGTGLTDVCPPPGAAPASAPAPAAAVPRRWPQALVAIIEDRLLQREFLVEILTDDLGCQTATAADGQAGLDLIAARRPQVALFDLFMPRLTGVEVLRHLRDRPAADRPRIVVLTANPGMLAHRPELGGLIDAVLTKPATVDAIIGAVGAALEAAQGEAVRRA